MRGGRSRLRNNAMTRATSPTRNGIFTRSFKAFLSTFSSVSVMVTVRTGPASYSFSLVVCAIFAFANPCFTEGNRNSRLWAVFGTLVKGLSYRSLNYRTGYWLGAGVSNLRLGETLWHYSIVAIILNAHLLRRGSFLPCHKFRKQYRLRALGVQRLRRSSLRCRLDLSSSTAPQVVSGPFALTK